MKISEIVLMRTVCLALYNDCYTLLKILLTELGVVRSDLEIGIACHRL
jgi:hypothetical protein